MQFKPVNPKQWEIVDFKGHPGHDSIWALALGADGHVYIGLGQEFTGGGVAQLYRYNVDRRRLEHCADMADVTGDRAENGHPTQGKIHFALCPARDNSIYGATHCTTPPANHNLWNPYGMWDDPLYSFQGGHLFRFDPSSGKCADFGVIFPNEGLPFLMLDDQRKRLYGVTYPKAHFFRMNTAGRGLVDYGRVSSWYPLALCFDREMNIFFSDTNSQLIKYDVQQDRLMFLRRTPYSEPWNRSKRFSWISNLALAGDGMIYGTHYCNDRLFRFDPALETPEFEDLGPGVPDRPSTLLRCLVPDNHNRIYYIAGPRAGSGDLQRLFVRYHIATGRKEVLGVMECSGRMLASWIGVVDRKGNIYMKGSNNPISLAIFRPGK